MSLTDYVARETRAEMARQQLTTHQLAAILEVNEMWLSRRIGRTKYPTPISLGDIELIAGALNKPVTFLLPRLDSNQQPFVIGRERRRVAA